MVLADRRHVVPAPDRKRGGRERAEIAAEGHDQRGAFEVRTDDRSRPETAELDPVAAEAPRDPRRDLGVRQALAQVGGLDHLLGRDPGIARHRAIGVAVNPGEKIVNWIPAWRASACADSVSALTPAFAAA